MLDPSAGRLAEKNTNKGSLMNKFAKGAIATGVGVILLAGGGGTLATWNQSVNASTGTVVSGDLNMVPGEGAWKNASGATIQIAQYKMVPGDTLTYTQPVTVTLTGDLMKAKLTVANVTGTGDFGTNATVSQTTLKNAAGGILPGTVLTSANNGQEVTASTTFTFKEGTTAQNATKAALDLGTVTYKLEQLAPEGSNAVPLG